MNYIKQNHLSLLIILFLVVSALFGRSPVVGDFGSINRPSTTVTNPVVFQQGVTISANANGTSDALTVNGTTTQAGFSYDGFVAWDDFTMGATGTAKAVFTNNSGVDMICSNGASYFNSLSATLGASFMVGMGVEANMLTE